MKAYVHLLFIAMIGFHNWDSVLCELRTEAEETVEHRL
jgi:hypothetical protein